MKVTYSWLIYSCLFFGSRILCDEKIESRQTISSCSENPEDKFYCSNGRCIEWSWVCNGVEDCSDGLDEIKELCLNKYGTNMTMDCGRVNLKNQIIYKDGMNKATVETAPWIVKIYQLNEIDSKHSFLCAGSLIAPNLVISAAYCFWREGFSKRILINDGRIKIVVGNYDRNFTVIHNEFTQVMNMEIVYLNEDYNGPDGSYANDIALIVLENKISFSNGVAPVCIDWNSKYKVQNGAEGKITVLGEMRNGTQSPVFLERIISYMDPSTCRKMYYTIENSAYFMTYDKFCSSSELEPVYSTLQGVGPGDYGAGISFLHSNSYFLTGILSIWNLTEKNTVLGFTDLKYHIQWIRRILNKHFTVNYCILPTVEGVIFSYEGSTDILSHGTLIKNLTTVIENCEVGYHQAYPNGFRVCRGNGKWLSNSEKLCFKMCPPLESDSLDIKCSHNGKYASCSNLSIPDTIARPSCKPAYSTPNGQDETPLELHCQSNGTWNKQLPKCNPHCGEVYILNQVLINNGEIARVGTVPWNVGIYRFNKQNSNYDMICGGSIIAPNLVVSVAHCFWEKGLISNRISVNDGLYKIAVGKYTRDFTVVDNDFTKIINVKKIHLNEGYYGPTGFHAKDIAVIVLQTRVSFSNGVAPVCIDWNGKYNVVNGKLGKIVGWGKTEKGIKSPILLEASLPYIDHRSCKNMYTNGFETFVTSDKFCAGSALGQGASQEDSGAGLSFIHSSIYFLTGILSVKDPDTNNSVAVFTNIKYHVGWLREIYHKNVAVAVNSCILPTVEGVVYTYEDSNEVLSHGTLIDHQLTVIENCEIGYHKVYSNSFRVCQENGKWRTVSDKLCFKMCPALESDSLDIKCSHNGKYANCSNLSIPDTIATPSCKPTYTAPNGQEETPLELHCQSNGMWNKELYKCKPLKSCILPTVDGVVYSYEGSNEVLSHGALINHQLTVIENCEIGYHKVYFNSFRVCQENGKWRTISDKLCFKMCPALESDSLDIKCSHNGKYANCSNLSIPDTIATPSCKPTYTAPNGQEETPLELHCQSNGMWNKELYKCKPLESCILPTVDGVVYSYEGSNEVLSHGAIINHHLTVIENCEIGYHKVYPNGFRFCQGNGKWITVYDKLCFKMCPPLESDSLDIKCSHNGKYANCSNLSIPDTIAIPSCKPTYTAPNGQAVTPFELLCQSNGTWNKQLYKCNPFNSCILPTVEGVVYSYKGSNEVLPHGTFISHHITVIENCEVGYHQAYLYRFRFCLEKGEWLSNPDQLCFKMCPPLESDSLDIKCSHNGKYANCSNLSIPDTIATPSCKPTYSIPNGQEETPLELHCQSNGTWNKYLYRCIPYCGKEYAINHVLIENGEQAPIGTAPWNVGIYQLNKQNSNYDMICGGSIISPNLVVSAHCFWQKGMLSKIISINNGLYKIAVGKYDRNFTVIDNDFTKIMNVETIHINEGYYGPIGFHAEDIAIIALQKRVSFNNGVGLVCVDWNGKNSVVNGDQGKIVGWGKTEKGISSPVLLEASLPYIDHSSCRDMYTNGFESFVTTDKFCAGSALVSGRGMSKGDSGAGLCFLHSNSYYLTGIVSVKDPSVNNSISVFTEVKHHIQWIRGLYNKYN